MTLLPLYRRPPPRELASPPRRFAVSPALAWVGVVFAALAWTALVRLPLWRMDGLDDAFYVEVARLWTRGLPPYLAVYDVKPPGFFALLAVAETALGPTLDALRALAVVCDAATAVALLMLGRRFGAPAVGVAAALVYPLLSELVTANDAYCPLAALTTFAFVAALSRRPPLERRACRRPADRRGGRGQADRRLRGAGAPRRPCRRARRPRGGACASRRPSSSPRRSRRSPFSPISPRDGGAGALVADAFVGALLRPASASEGLTFLDGLGRFFLLQKSDMRLFALVCLALLRRRALAAAPPDAPLGALVLWFAAAAAVVLVQRVDRRHLSRPDARAGPADRRPRPDPRRAGACARPAGMRAARRARLRLGRDRARSSRQRPLRPVRGRGACRGRRGGDSRRRPDAGRPALCRQPRPVALRRARRAAADPLPLSRPHALRLQGSRPRPGRRDPRVATPLRRRRRPAHPLRLRTGGPLAGGRRRAGGRLPPRRPRRRRGRLL